MEDEYVYKKCFELGIRTKPDAYMLKELGVINELEYYTLCTLLDPTYPNFQATLKYPNHYHEISKFGKNKQIIINALKNK